MSNTKSQVEARVSRLADFEPRSARDWKEFVKEFRKKPPVCLKEGDHEVDFTARLGRTLQKRYVAKLKAGQRLTHQEVMSAANSIDFQGRTREAHVFLMDILHAYWKYWELLPPGN